MTRRTVRLLLLAAVTLASQLTAAEGPWAAVDTALGRDGKDLPGEVRKYCFPRTDLAVTAAGVSIEPPLALGSWAAFRRHAKGGVMAMGDLVVLPSELGAVIRALARGGL